MFPFQDRILGTVFTSSAFFTVTDRCGVVGYLPSAFDPSSRMVGGKNATYGDDPWHAAIYRRRRKENKDPLYICGATLVSSTVLVSGIVTPHASGDS